MQQKSYQGKMSSIKELSQELMLKLVTYEMLNSAHHTWLIQITVCIICIIVLLAHCYGYG